jgi:hypothetical protein
MVEMSEWSTNFDLESVEPFLRRVCTCVDSGFSDIEIDGLLAMVRDMKMDEEKQVEFNIAYCGTTSLLRITVFMDDINAPDIHFFGPRSLCEEMSNIIEDFSV